MTSVVLDMEWSQPITKDKIVTMNGKALPVEIIQIGAVIVENGEIVSRFSQYVRPRVYRIIKSKIRRLTGISEKDLVDAKDFTKVMKDFRKWITPYEPQYTVTWGCNDIPLLNAQCEAYNYHIEWLPESFDLQPIFTRQRNIDRPQISLASAIEEAGVSSEESFHSAINDAYYTALLLNTVDHLEKRIEWQKKADRARETPIASLVTCTYGSVSGEFDESMLSEGYCGGYIPCHLCGYIHSFPHLTKAGENNYVGMLECKNHSINVNITVEVQSDKWAWKCELVSENVAGNIK